MESNLENMKDSLFNGEEINQSQREMGERLNKLMEEEEFSQAILKATSFEEVADVLHEYGIEVSVEDLQRSGNEAVEQLKEDGLIAEDGELSQELLEEVTGGKLSAGGKTVLAGVGMMGVGLASDYLAGACAVALVSNPLGWFVGGVAVAFLGAYMIGRSRRRR